MLEGIKRLLNSSDNRGFLDADISWWPSGSATSSGANVTPNTAMTISTFNACVRYASETVGTLPIDIYRKTNEGKEVVLDHDQRNLLKYEPSPNYTSSTFRITVIAQLLLYGNSFAIIHRNGSGRPISYELRPSNCIELRLHEGRVAYWDIEKKEVFLSHEILHFMDMSDDGIWGRSRVQVLRESLGETLAARNYGSSFFKNGVNIGSVLMSDRKMSKESILAYKKSFKAAHTPGDLAVLEQGVKYEPIKSTIPFTDADYIASRNLHAEEICRMFLIPPHIVGIMGKMSFNNIYEMQINAVNNCIRPLCKIFTAELNRKIFKSDNKYKEVVDMDLKGLLEGDPAGRAQLYKLLSDRGAMNRNEMRAKENMNAVDGGDQYYISHNMIPVEMAGKIFNTGNSNTDEREA